MAAFSAAIRSRTRSHFASAVGDMFRSFACDFRKLRTSMQARLKIRFVG
jgi:hypothetical protein